MRILVLLLCSAGLWGSTIITPSTGSGGTWGSVTGTLSDQTDLQSALDAKQDSDTELTAIAGLTSAADRLPYFTGPGTASLATFTAAGRSMVSAADGAAQAALLNAITGASSCATATQILFTASAGVADCDPGLTTDGTSLTITKSALAATVTPVLFTTNAIASTVGTPVQMPGAFSQIGTAWDVDSAVSRTATWRESVLPVSGNTISATKTWCFQIDAGSCTTAMTLTGGGALTIGGTLTSSAGDVQVSGTRYIGFSSRTFMSSPSDSKLLLTNFAGSDFNSLQFGGTTSSFPSLKRSTTGIQSRLADDSNFGFFQGLYKSTDGTDGVTVTTCTGFKDGLCISGT